MEKRIYIIRHGETDWNRLRKFQGQSDIPLNENGRRQAEELAEKLKDVLPFDRIVASNLGRAVETAAILSRGYPTPILTDAGFREMDFGEWEGLDEETIERRWPGALQSWFDTGMLSIDSGETQEQLYDRVWRSFRHWADKPDYQKMAIVSHGGSGSALLCAVLGKPSKEMKRYMLKNAGIIVMIADSKGGYGVDDASSAQYMRV